MLTFSPPPPVWLNTFVRSKARPICLSRDACREAVRQSLLADLHSLALCDEMLESTASLNDATFIPHLAPFLCSNRRTSTPDEIRETLLRIGMPEETLDDHVIQALRGPNSRQALPAVLGTRSIHALADMILRDELCAKLLTDAVYHLCKVPVDFPAVISLIRALKSRGQYMEAIALTVRCDAELAVPEALDLFRLATTEEGRALAKPGHFVVPPYFESVADSAKTFLDAQRQKAGISDDALTWAFQSCCALNPDLAGITGRWLFLHGSNEARSLAQDYLKRTLTKAQYIQCHMLSVTSGKDAFRRGSGLELIHAEDSQALRFVLTSPLFDADIGLKLAAIQKAMHMPADTGIIEAVLEALGNSLLNNAAQQYVRNAQLTSNRLIAICLEAFTKDRSRHSLVQSLHHLLLSVAERNSIGESLLKPDEGIGAEFVTDTRILERFFKAPYWGSDRSYHYHNAISDAFFRLKDPRGNTYYALTPVSTDSDGQQMLGWTVQTR